MIAAIHVVEFVAMRARVSGRAEHALFFAGKQHEANRAARDGAGSVNHARRVNHHRGVAAVVERARAQFPGIEMRAEQDEFVRLFAPANFGDDIFRFYRAGDFVGHVEMNVHRHVVGEKARHAFGVFAREMACGSFSISPFAEFVWR